MGIARVEVGFPVSDSDGRVDRLGGTEGGLGDS